VQTETNPPILTPASQLIEKAEQLLVQGTPAALRECIACVDSGLEVIATTSDNPSAAQHLLVARLLLARGNAQRDLHDLDAFKAALESYRKAMDVVESKPLPENASPFDQQLAANICTNHGIALLHAENNEAVREAITLFEKSIALRKDLPRDMNNVLWGLAAGWMNRGDALTRLRKEGTLPEAVKSYDEALACLQELGGYDHPPFVVRLAVAWMNRGHSLMAMETPEGIAKAIQSFESAMHVMQRHPNQDAVECCATLGCAIMCHAAARMEQGPEHADEVAEEARGAIALVLTHEKEDLLSTEVSIKSRHLLCRTLATKLDRTPPDAPEVDEWITEVTDTVDEGMALERHWEQRGLTGFRLMAVELFRFGIRVFFIRQPHFLAEFILECLDPERSAGAPVTSEEMHHLAGSALWDAALRIDQQQRSASTQEKASLIEIIGDLHAADRRLQELREKYLGKSEPVAV
jgi:tetratricopeptide (TPR) repeat protein